LENNKQTNNLALFVLLFICWITFRELGGFGVGLAKDTADADASQTYYKRELLMRFSNDALGVMLVGAYSLPFFAQLKPFPKTNRTQTHKQHALLLSFHSGCGSGRGLKESNSAREAFAANNNSKLSRVHSPGHSP
jgi:hypothetical protein